MERMKGRTVDLRKKFSVGYAIGGCGTFMYVVG